MINIQPTLVGKLIKLRPIREIDFQPLYKAASDPLIWEQHPQPLRYQRDFFKEHFFQGGIESKGCLVVENHQSDIIGCSRYYNYRPQKRDIWIGYTFLTRECWSGGYNREMKHLMMSHIYQWVDTIFFTVGVNNKRSRLAMTNIGGKILSSEEETIKEISLKDNVIFEIEKNNFKG